MTIVTTRDFRANQSKYIAMAHRGEEVVLSSARAGRVRLVPEYDNEITPDLQSKIDAARKVFREGKCISLNSHEEIDAYFESL